MTGETRGTDREDGRTEDRDEPGPLSYALAVSSAREWDAHAADAHRRAWERVSGGRPEPAPKRLLVAVSHAIEKAVMSGPIEPPTVVVALFQRLAFFERERLVYERMAAAGVHVLVGFVEGGEHEPPAGVHTVLLRSGEALAEEWSVVAVGPRAGAFLVATDRHQFDPAERDLEASRQFQGRWGYAHNQAAAELARLRLALGTRMDESLTRTVDTLLTDALPSGGQSAGSSGTPGETWASTSLYHMIDRMQTAQAGSRELREQLADAHDAAAAVAAATVDPHSGLPNPDFLERWSTPATGTTALPVGLGLFDVAELGGEALREDPRAAYHGARRVAAALSQPLGPVDAVVRLSEREFLLVVPGASPRHLAALCDEIAEQLELASGGYPDIALTSTMATIVTRSRPLPLDDLRAALRHAGQGGPGPVDAGRTPAGDRIFVASTSSDPDQRWGPDDEPPDDDPAGRHEEVPDPPYLVEPTDRADPVEPRRPVSAVRPVESRRPVSAAEPAESRRPVSPVEPAESVRPAEPRRPVPAVEAVEPPPAPWEHGHRDGEGPTRPGSLFDDDHTGEVPLPRGHGHDPLDPRVDVGPWDGPPERIFRSL